MKLRHVEPQVAESQAEKREDPRLTELSQALERSQQELESLRLQTVRQKDEADASGEERELWLASQGLALQKQTRELEYLRVRAVRLDADLKDLVRRYTLVMDELAKVSLTPKAPPSSAPKEGMEGSGARLSLSSDAPVTVSTGYVPPYRPPLRKENGTGMTSTNAPSVSLAK